MRFKSIFVSVALAPLCLCSSVFSQDGLPLFRKMQDALGGAGRIAGDAYRGVNEAQSIPK